MAKFKSKATPTVKQSTGNQALDILQSIPKGEGPVLYDRVNYLLMGLGALFIIIGFVLMSGGAHPDPNVFDAEEVYSFRRITLAPLLIIIGFIIELFAVLKKPSAPEA